MVFIYDTALGASMPQTNSLSFATSQDADKALKTISQQLVRAGQSVAASEFVQKPRRASGVTYREAFITLASGQLITLRVNATGDLYQVLLNNQVKPLKEHTDTAKAVAEIALLAEKNQEAFQKAQARKAVALPKGMSTPKPRMVERLKQQVSELDTQLAERRSIVTDLQTQLGADAMTDSANQTSPVILLPLASAYVAARELAKDDGAMLDNAATAGAADWLRVGLEMVENNCPINLERGDIEQARHQMRMATSFRSALTMLDSASGMNDAAFELLVAIAQADAMDEDGITSQEALASLLGGGLVEASDGFYFLTEKGRQRLNDDGYDAYGQPFAAGAE